MRKVCIQNGKQKLDKKIKFIFSGYAFYMLWCLTFNGVIHIIVRAHFRFNILIVKSLKSKIQNENRDWQNGIVLLFKQAVKTPFFVNAWKDEDTSTLFVYFHSGKNMFIFSQETPSIVLHICFLYDVLIAHRNEDLNKEEFIHKT